jgi:hypothetical protein
MDYQIEERTYCVPNEVMSILIFHSTNKTYEGIPPDGLYKTLSASVNNLQLSVDGGVGWIDLGSNKTIMIPKGISTFKLRIPTLDDKVVTTADKRFEIIFTEQTAPETTNINTNNKITVSIRYIGYPLRYFD